MTTVACDRRTGKGKYRVKVKENGQMQRANLDKAEEARHPADYVEGDAPRTDALSSATINKGSTERFFLMRAHARALEIELQEIGHDLSRHGGKA